MVAILDPDEVQTESTVFSTPEAQDTIMLFPVTGDEQEEKSESSKSHDEEIKNLQDQINNSTLELESLKNTTKAQDSEDDEGGDYSARNYEIEGYVSVYINYNVELSEDEVKELEEDYDGDFLSYYYDNESELNYANYIDLVDGDVEDIELSDHSWEEI